jgi:hypothetical protein
MSLLTALFARLWPLIVSDFLQLFEEFRAKQWALLWRESRDGFDATDLHCYCYCHCYCHCHCHYHCNGYANILTRIWNTHRNIFGGFTPAELESDFK